MKRIVCLVIVLVFGTINIFAALVHANNVDVTVPVQVSGIHQGVNHWADATYTCTVTDGVPSDNGILSNGKYTFRYYPSTGQIINNTPDTVPAFAYLPDFSDIPIVFPSEIGAFDVGTASYPKKSIEIYAATAANGIFAKTTSADTDIVIPEGVESIPNYAFANIPNSSRKIGFILPSTLKTIGDAAFVGISGGGTIHKNVIIPDGVTSIGRAAFGSCKFTEVVVPAGVTVINDTTLGYMYNLKSVTLNGEVTSIGPSAFRNNSGIEMFIFKGKTAPTTINKSAFQGLTQSFTVYYPPDGVGYEEGGTFRADLAKTSPQITYKKGTPTFSDLTRVRRTDSGYDIDYSVTLGIDELNRQIENVKTVIALYNDKNLVEYRSVDSNETSVTITTDKRTTAARLYLWDGFLDIKPLASAKTISTVYSRGVNIAGAEFGGTGGTYTWNNEETFKYFAEKGFDTMRVPLKWERMQPVLYGDLDQDYLNGLKSNIAWAKKYGAMVIIDVHNYGRYNSKIIGLNPDVPISSFTDLWVRLSNEFKDESGVYAYDIMNEPHGMGDGENHWKIISQEVVTAVRNNNDNSLIMIEGLFYSHAHGWAKNNDSETSWITDPADNFIYSAHCYFDPDQSGTYTNSYNYYLSQNSDFENLGIYRVMDFINWCKKNNVRGHIGEFGVPRSDPRWNIVLEKFMTLLDENGIESTYWAAGHWWNATYSMNLQPTDNYTTDRPQMAVLEKHLPQR